MVVNAKFNLPQDVLRAIPVQTIQNSEQGAVPTDAWGHIVNAGAGVAVIKKVAN